MNLEQHIEALLFYRGEPVAISALEKTFETDEATMRTALDTLSQSLANRGIRLMELNGEVELRTAPESVEIIRNIRKEELAKDLGKAGMETLSIILYQGPLSRADIDYIRGVNSSFILRNLLIRNLIDRVPNPKDERSFLYRGTVDLLAFMGVSKIEDLPDYEKVRAELKAISDKQALEHDGIV